MLLVTYAQRHCGSILFLYTVVLYIICYNFWLWCFKVKVNLECVLPPTVYSECEEGKTGKLHGSGQVAGTLLSLRATLCSPPILHPKKSESFLLTGEVRARGRWNLWPGEASKESPVKAMVEMRQKSPTAVGKEGGFPLKAQGGG